MGAAPGFLEMSGHGFVDALRLDEFHEPQLRGFVAVVRGGAALHHHARSGLQNSAWPTSVPSSWKTCVIPSLIPIIPLTAMPSLSSLRL